MAIRGPCIITAHRLTDGRVVYFTEERSWSPLSTEAKRMETPGDAKPWLDAAEADRDQNRVLDVYLVEVEPQGPPNPQSLRERIRAIGPTVRADLGRARSLEE